MLPSTGSWVNPAFATTPAPPSALTQLPFVSSPFATDAVPPPPPPYHNVNDDDDDDTSDDDYDGDIALFYDDSDDEFMGVVNQGDDNAIG